MALVTRAEGPEGFSWKCHRCNTRDSVCTQSFFAQCVFSIDNVLVMMYYWSLDVKARRVMLFEGIDSWHRIVNYNNFFRVDCLTWLNTQHVDLGGFDEMDSRCMWRLTKRITFIGSTIVAGTGEDAG